MSTMKDLARIVADRYDISRTETEQFVNEMFDVLKSELAADELVKIKGLGTFKIQTMQERASVDVNTGEKIVIDSHDRITFTPDAAMKESVNKPFAHFETVPINDGVVFDDLEDVSKEPEALEEPKVTDEPKVDIQPETIEIPVVTNEPEAVEVNETEAAEVNEPEAVKIETPAPTPLFTAPEPEENNDTEPITVSETEPETVSEVVPETVSETVSEVVPETVSEVVPEEVPETEPETEPEVISEPELEPELQTENQENQEIEMEYNDDINPSVDNDKLSGWVIALLAMLLLVVGFVIGRATADISFDDVKEMVYPSKGKVVKDKVVVAPIEVDSAALAKEDSIKQEEAKKAEAKAAAEKADEKKADENAEAQKPEEKILTVSENNRVQKPAAQKPAATQGASNANTAQPAPTQAKQEVSTSAYDNDPRIRLGAYRIVGVQKTVTVREGQTLASISKAYLGPGMECYVEALNGIKEVKAGQQVKIPELKVKKKKSSK